MRFTAFFLALIALFVVGNIAVSAVYPPYREVLHSWRGAVTETPSVSNAPSKSQDEALIASLQKVDAGLTALVENASGSTSASSAPPSASLSKVPTIADPVGAFSSGLRTTGTQSPISPATVPTPISTKKVTYAPVPVVIPDVPVPKILLARLIPSISVKKVDNKGIFNILLFQNLVYTTYSDDKTHLRLYAFDDRYDTILSNLKLVPTLYSIKETDTFFGNTFFLNSTNKKDVTVRFVIALEGKAVGFEMPKTLYQKVKKLLLQS